MPKLCVEYSKSGRAKCSNTSCGKKIEKHELRVGTEVIMPFSDDGVETWKWRHLCCFTERQLSNAKGSGDIDDIQGESDLAPADKALVDKMREGKLVGDTSILGRIGDVAHSPLASELTGKGGKATKAATKPRAPAEGSAKASASEPTKKRPRGAARPGQTGAAGKDTDGDVDSEATDEYEVEVEASPGKPKCPYAASCFRTNPEHFQHFVHEDRDDTAVATHDQAAPLRPVIKRKKQRQS